MENPIKMDDLGIPLFSETSIYTYLLMVQKFWLTTRDEAVNPVNNGNKLATSTGDRWISSSDQYL